MRFRLALLLFMLSLPAAAKLMWWDSSWDYRVCMSVNVSNYSREFWPVEFSLNLTSEMASTGAPGYINISSLRLIEENFTTGAYLSEIASQFDPLPGFNATTNFIGTLSWIMNGTVPAFTIKSFCLYYDTDNKLPTNYQNMSYVWDGEELHVNVTIYDEAASSYKGLQYFIDTSRGNNESGIYRIKDYGGSDFWGVPSQSEDPTEFIEYSNATDTFSFDLQNNMSIISSGPVKTVVEQTGPEVYWNTSTQTEGWLTKKYTFYNQSQWIVVEQNYSNTAGYEIVRNSTPAGALSLNLTKSSDPNEYFNSIIIGDGNEPGSWYWFAQLFANAHLGVINLYNTGNFSAVDRDSVIGRGGIELSATPIPASGWIYDKAVLHFNSGASQIRGSPTDAQVRNLRNRLMWPENTSISVSEKWAVVINTSSDYTNFNKAENVTLLVNSTVDSGLITSINATVMSDGGNFSIDLYDDGTHGDVSTGDGLYTNTFEVNIFNSTGIWNVTSYAWDQSNLLLNTSSYSFNVYDTYTSNLSISNPYGFVGRVVDAILTLTNYRNDTYIGEAQVNCTYFNGTDILENFTDYGNGTYSLNFTAPSSFDYYTLVCNSTKLNNTGSATADFVAIEYVTSVTNYLGFAQGTGDNATLYERYNFSMLSNVTNLGNGSAYDINVSISLPSGWLSNSTFEYLPDLNLTNYSHLFFELSAPPNTTPGYYILNSTTRWKNSDNSSGEVNNTFNISIEKNPEINIFETLINHTVSPGVWNYLENITIESWGNYPAENVSFNVSGIDTMTFNFTPSPISSLPQGQNQSVEIWVYVPDNQTLGIYNGTLTAFSNGTSDTANITLNILITYLGVTATPNVLNSTQMRWYEYENFTVTINSSNIGTTVAQNSNITLSLPEANWATNVTNNSYSCGDILVGEYCARSFNIGLIKSTPQNYTIVANVSWINPGVGVAYNTTNITVVVASNKEFIINESYVAGPAYHGASTIIGSYTLINTGNDQVNGMSTSTSSLPDFTVVYYPDVSILPPGNVTNVDVNITVPPGYSPGLYIGTANVSSSDASFKSVYLNVTVPTQKTWTMSPDNCTTEVAFDTGKMCTVSFNNTGNANIDFTISPSTSNYTYPNTTTFTLTKQSGVFVDFFWNLTGVPRDYYNATYNIGTVGGSPFWTYLNLSMIPRELAEINASFSKNITQELEVFTIFVNVTDKSGQGLNFSRVRVFKPDNSTEVVNLIFSSQSNVSYQFYTPYPTTGGISDVFGNYTFQIEVQDNLGLTSRLNISKYIYPLLNISIDTGFDTYFLGETASIYINTTDFSKTTIPSNVSMQIYDPAGDLRYDGVMVTTGRVLPIPTLSIPSDSPIGNYTVIVNATHHDDFANESVYSNNTYQFRVREDYNVDFDTSLVWYPDSTMNFYVLTYGDRPFPPPDKINLTVYDPAQNVYLSTESFSQFKASNTSVLYTHSFAMPVDSPVGYYLAVLTLEEGGRKVEQLKSFRVTYGGPFDVVITNLKSEVKKGDAQDFGLLLENMGDFGQDVYLDYWIEKDGTKYDGVTGEAIFVAAGDNRTLNRSLSIFSTQATGNYTLHAKLNYSKVNPPIEVTRSFLVVAPTNQTTPPKIIEPVEAAVIELTVTNLFPDQLILNRGSIGYLTIEVKNTGNVDLNDITAFFEDVDKEWFEVVRNIDSLRPGATGYIVVKFTIPDSASARTYVSKMRIISKETEVSEFYKLLIFKTQEEALRARITTLKNELIDLEDQTGQVAARGGDVTKILSLLRKARELLDVADTYLLEDSTVDAIKTISEAEGVIEEIKYRLEIAKPDFLPTVLLPQVPTNWYLILIALAMVILVAVIALKKFRFFRDKERRSSLMKIRNTLVKSRQENEYSEVYDAIKDQYEEGMISRETFEELKDLIK